MPMQSNLLIRCLPLLVLAGMSCGCSGTGDEDLERASASPADAENVGAEEQSIAEAACYQQTPDATLSPFGKGTQVVNQSPTVYGVPIGQIGCTVAWKLRVRPTGVVQSRLNVKPTVVPSAAECTGTMVRAIVYRNQVFQRDLKAIGTLVGSTCNAPSVGDIFNFGDGADWRVIVQAVVGPSSSQTRSVKTTLTNQQQ